MTTSTTWPRSKDCEVIDAALKDIAVILPSYLLHAPSPFPTTALETLKMLTEMADELHLYAMEGHQPADRDVSWRIAFLVALYANMVQVLSIPCEEASALLSHLLHEQNVPARCALIAQVRYTHLLRGESVEHVDTHILPHEMKKILASQ